MNHCLHIYLWKGFENMRLFGFQIGTDSVVVPLKSHHLLRKVARRGTCCISDTLSYRETVLLSSVVRPKMLRWPSAGKPQPYATSFPISFPSSWSLVQRLQELDKMQSNGISQACSERMQRLHLCYHHNWTCCSFFCLSQETSSTEQMTSRHIHPIAAQWGSCRKC